MLQTYDHAEKMRLDKYLHAEFSAFSRTRIQKFIAKNAVLVNAKRASVHHWLKRGDVIEMPDIALSDAVGRAVSESDGESPKVLYRDENYAVVLKPAGLLMHPAHAGNERTLASWARETFSDIDSVGDDAARAGIVHRLDRDVGGLILLALNQDAYTYYKRLFQSRSITKKYYALVHGVISADSGSIDAPLERHKKTGKIVSQTQTKTGKEAHTLYRVLRRFAAYTLLDVQIVTGRTHQIRVHFFSIGHGIAGDTLYRTRDIRKRKRAATEPAQPFLFAYYLHFRDQRGQDQTYEAPMPPALQHVLNTLS